ncbi:MAG: RNA polymerase sigma-70 factor [Bacteroidota bacterium]|nr:RNA polymerase sigma-70 factor [Bacteroidota bacterium]
MNNYSNIDSRILLKAIAEEDSEPALESLYSLYFDRLMRFVQLYMNSEQESEEIISDVFFTIWKNRKSLPEIKNVNAYLYKMARNLSIDYQRKHKMNFDRLEDLPFDLYLKTETTPEDDLVSKELIDQLNEAINALPNQCKMAFKLIREDQMKYKEAAEILNVSVKTLEAHITKAMKVLTQVINSTN